MERVFVFGNVLEDIGPQTDLHSVAVHDIFRTLLLQRSDSVLIAGMYLCNDNYNFMCMWPNAAATLVQSKTWEAIHARIGTKMLRYLLISCTVFAPDVSGVIWQVSGPKPKPFQRPPRSQSCFYNERFLKHAGFEPEHPLFDPNPLRDHHTIVRDMYGITGRLPKRFKCMLGHVQYVLQRNSRINYKARLFGEPYLCIWRWLRRILPLGDNKWVLHDWLRKSLRNPREPAHFPWRTKGFLPRHLHKHYAELIGGWTRWIWNTLVIPLIRNHWYVTEDCSYIRKTELRSIPARIELQRIDTIERAHQSLLCANGRLVQRCFLDEKFELRAVLKCMNLTLHWGATVTNFEQVFQKLVAFKKRNTLYYFVKFDIAKAFDSIDQRKLCQLIERCDIFPHPFYVVMRYRINGRLVIRVAPPPKGVVATDCAWGQVLQRSELYNIVFEHICYNLVWFRGKKFLQTKGIPQGSVLSPALCCLYYAHELEEGIELDDCLRMRWVDDTIFITSDYAKAEAFLNRISHLIPLFNQLKSILKVSSSMTWCGLKFNAALEVSWDYKHPVDVGNVKKFVYYARAKFGLKVLFSARMNARGTIIQNAREALRYLKRKVPHLHLNVLTNFCNYYFRHDPTLFRLAVGTWGY